MSELSKLADLAEVLPLVDVLDRHEPDELWVLVMMVEGDLGRTAHRLGRWEVAEVDGPFRSADAAIGALEHRDVELLLGVEVVVDHPLGGRGAGCDLVDPGPRVAHLGEDLSGDVEHVRS